MRGLVQRVTRASVSVDGEVVGAVGPGVCLLVGVTHTDTEAHARRLAEKVWGLRIMADDEGVMNRGLGDVGGEVLVVSQFTLYGDASKGRRPSFIGAAPPEIAEGLYDDFVRVLRSKTARSVETGEFGAMMEVDLVNDGPVTLVLERD